MSELTGDYVDGVVSSPTEFGTTTPLSKKKRRKDTERRAGEKRERNDRKGRELD